jgi:hypothetical protein
VSKKQLTKDVEVCDVCGTDKMVFSHCNNCSKDYCYECAKTHAVTYSHGVYCGGSGDACYCNACRNELLKKGDVRLLAYLKIQDLRAEAKRWSEDFNMRQEHAEKVIRDMRQ